MPDHSSEFDKAVAAIRANVEHSFIWLTTPLAEGGDGVARQYCGRWGKNIELLRSLTGYLPCRGLL
jgi:hypothetical protein